MYFLLVNHSVTNAHFHSGCHISSETHLNIPVFFSKYDRLLKKNLLSYGTAPDYGTCPSLLKIIVGPIELIGVLMFIHLILRIFIRYTPSSYDGSVF